MAIVKMRDLLRSPGAVFEDLEKGGEPVLITRNGDPLAMLTRVEPADAMSAVMSALPEVIDRRRNAEFARDEGRVASGDEVIARLTPEAPPEEQTPRARRAHIRGSMNRKDLVAVVADTAVVEQETVDAVLRALQSTLEVAVAEGAKVSVPGFFALSVGTRAAREGRNPATGETIRIPAAKAVKLTAGSALKQAADHDA